MKSASLHSLRWTLRVMSGFCILFLMFLFVFETFFPPDFFNSKSISDYDNIQIMVVLLGIIGLIIAWKWELFGGIVGVMGFIGLGIMNPTILISPFLIFIVISVFFILLGAKSKTLKNQW
jgi:hypothetical protein